MTHVLDLSTWEAETGELCEFEEFEVNLVYREFQDSQSYVEKLCLKSKNKQTKKHVTVISALGRKRKDSEVRSQSELHGNSKAIWVIWNHVFKF